MTYLEAQRMVDQLMRDKEIVSYSNEYSASTGRAILVETEQGWCPYPFWQEIEPAYDCTQDI